MILKIVIIAVIVLVFAGIMAIDAHYDDKYEKFYEEHGYWPDWFRYGKEKDKDE